MREHRRRCQWRPLLHPPRGTAAPPADSPQSASGTPPAPLRPVPPSRTRDFSIRMVSNSPAHSAHCSTWRRISSIVAASNSRSANASRCFRAAWQSAVCFTICPPSIARVPMPQAFATSASSLRNAARPRLSRDITVPTGTPMISAASLYENSSTSTNSTTSRNVCGIRSRADSIAPSVNRSGITGGAGIVSCRSSSESPNSRNRNNFRR